MSEVLQGLDFFGGKRASAHEAVQFAAHVAAAEDDRIVFLSDVWLDKPGTHDRLRVIFDGEPCCAVRAGCLHVQCSPVSVHATALWGD